MSVPLSNEAARLTLVPVTLAKGLEFDHVVLVEPSRIATGEAYGLRRLYVALTRAVSRLTVFHAEPLPAELVCQRNGVAGGLGHRELAFLALARSVAPQVGEDVAELRGVQVVGQRPPAQGRAEPAVQRDDAMVPLPDRDVRASHGS